MKIKDFWYGMLNGWCMNYDSTHKLDVLLIFLNDIGIKKISTNTPRYDIIIEFNDGTIMKGWNVNRWYAWLSQGELKCSNGEYLSWYSERPRHEIIYKYKKIVKKWEKEQKKCKSEYSDFNKYLPKAYVKRMERLKKLQEIEKHTT